MGFSATVPWPGWVNDASDRVYPFGSDALPSTLKVKAIPSSVWAEMLLAIGGIGGAPIVSMMVPTPEPVAITAPAAVERFISKVKFGFAVVSARIGTEIVWLNVPGLNVSVPDVAL